MNFKHVRFAQNHMATTFTFTVSVPSARVSAAERVLTQAHALVHKLECELSEFIADSYVARINRSEPGEPVPVGPPVMELLGAGARICNQTAGAFNYLAKSEGGTTGKSLQFDRESGTVSRSHSRAHLGFGAIGKGYALDQVRSLLEQEGFTDYFLNAGGSSLIMAGFAAPGVPWDWSWSWIKDNHDKYYGVSMQHQSGLPVALGVSGTFEQGLHLLQPHSGAKVQSVQSALVAHPSATEADALSTALFILGWEDGQEKLGQTDQPPAVAVVDRNNTPRWNGIFHELWGAPSVAAAALLCFLCAIPARADEAVDLAELGLGGFNPYVFERNFWWIILPALLLLIVISHIPLPWKPRQRK